MESVNLEAVPLFAALDPEDRARVATLARPMQWDVGHVVVREGEFAFDFYAIKDGAAVVQQGGHHLAALGAGDFFGELGVVPNDARHWSRRRTASVVVTAPTQAIAIDGSDVRRLVEEIPTLGDALRAAAAGRTRSETR